MPGGLPIGPAIQHQGKQRRKAAVHIGLGLVLGLGLAACSRSQGAQIYQDSGCPRCHGVDREGGATGPPLQGLRYTWTRQDLIRFLQDPSAFALRDTRLRELSQRFDRAMPAFAIGEQDREILTDYLLER